MSPETISISAAQGLAKPPERPGKKEDVLAAIRRVGVLQIDSINVVARSPYLVLWSRLGDFTPAWLDELLAEGALFEYVSHAMCFLPIEDYPLYRRSMLDLFGFDYTIECYTPAARRRFGYFTLPILHRGALVGRLDPKAHRALGQFEVKGIALEPGVAPSDDLVAGLAVALRRLAAWHGTADLIIRRSEPADLAGRLLA